MQLAKFFALLVSNIFFLAFFSQITIVNVNALDTYKHHNYEEMTAELKQFSRRFPQNTYLYSIGKSVQKREIWVMAIADSDPGIHVHLRPEAKYVANMHGNEVVGRELLLSLIDHMLSNQTTDSSVAYLLKNTRIHILPSLNPDGWEAAKEGDCNGVEGRHNANHFDLNRNFPDLFENNSAEMQPETKAIVDWLEATDFILSANFHGGALVVNYPYDSYKDALGPKENPTSDNDVFKSIALNYSTNHPFMKEKNCYFFENGITNGASWYPIDGSMQDYNYWKHGIMETTMEISCCKYPLARELKKLWLLNQKSLIEYLKLANTGVRGIVKFEDGTKAKYVTIQIDQRQPYFKTNKDGEYYRILLPGAYNVSVAFECMNVFQAQIAIPSDTRLLEFNIVLTIEWLAVYKTTSMNKFAKFCCLNSRDGEFFGEQINSAFKVRQMQPSVLFRQLAIFGLFLSSSCTFI